MNSIPETVNTTLEGVNSQTPTLTAYEADQVRRIAGWKAEHPGYISGLIDKLTRPLVKLAEKSLPANFVADTIRDVYASSQATADCGKVLERAGVESLRELWTTDLKVCDSLATEFMKSAEQHAMLTGAGSGGGNLLSALIVTRSLMTYCLKTAHTIAACYGFGTEEDHEREYIFGVILIAAASTLEEKQHAIVTVGHVEDLILEDAFEEVLEDKITEQIFQSGGLSSIPAIGILAGAVQFATITQHVAQVARYVFQERWLRVNGKLLSRIEPQQELARPFYQRAGIGVASTAYWSTFGIGFLVSVPVMLLAQWIPMDNAFGRGVLDGRDAAARDAEQVITKVTGGVSTATPAAPTIVAAMSPA